MKINTSRMKPHNPQKDHQVALMAVGDIMLGDRSLCLGFGVGSKIKKEGPAYPFLKVASVLREGNIIFGNLEAVISSKGLKSKNLRSLQLRAIPQAVEGLKFAGFNVLSLANNHILEHGQEALSETINLLIKNDIQFFGVESNDTKARKPLKITINDITVAFLGYCLIPDETAYISVNNPEEICHDVQNTKTETDSVVVSLHWGSEYIHRPSPTQIELAHKIIDSGAQLILGHHPHVLQGIEKYHGGVIAYSLGNFVFDMREKKLRRSMIIRVCLSRDGVSDFQVLPVGINRNYQPQLLEGEQAKRLVSDIENLSSKIMNEKLTSGYQSIQEYKREVKVCRRRFRRGLKLHFLRNIYRYPFSFLLYTLKNYLLKYRT